MYQRESTNYLHQVLPRSWIVEASVPVSSNFMDPAVTVIAPDKVLPDAMETGVM